MPVFRPGPRRRAPYPFDLKLGATGLMLGRGRGADGKPAPFFVTSESDDLNRVAPTDFGYSAQDPGVERTQPYDDPTLGFGLPRQLAFRDHRYKYTVNADLSGAVIVKGPDVPELAPATRDSASGVSGGFDLGGATYAVNGRYVLRRDDDTSWGVSRDFGAGKVALDAVTFHSNALAADLAFVALGDTANFHYFDGATWTTATGATMQARAFAVVGREFYRARDTNLLCKCDTDANPTVEANWGAHNAFRIGDKSAAITRMFVNAAGVLVVVKTDGIYSLATDGQDIEYVPALGLIPDAVNGKGAGAFLNDWLIPFRQGLVRLTPDFRVDPNAGPDTQNGTDWLAGMRTTAVVGHGNLHAYAGVTDETDGYLFKLLPSGVWHGSVSGRFEGKRISALWKSTAGAPAGHARVYLGFSDGTVGHFVAPNTTDVSADPAYRFATADGEVHPADFTSTVPNDPKVLYAATVNGRNLGADAFAQLEYKVDPAQPDWTPLGVNFDANRERASFPDNTSGAIIPLKLVLKSTSTSTSPEVTGAGIHHAWRPERREIYGFSVLCEDGLVRWDNVPLRLGRARIRQVVEGVRDAQGSVTATLPDHTLMELTVTRIEDGMAFDDRTRQWRSAITVRAVQFEAQSVYGTHGRLEAYTHGQLESFGSHARLEQL